MDFSVIDGFLASNTVDGTNIYGGNVRSMDETLPGGMGNTPGVGVGQAMSTRIFMTFSDFTAVSASTYTNNQIVVPANSSVFFPVGSYVTPADANGVNFGNAFTDINGNTYMRFRSGCKLFINLNGSSTFTGVSVQISYKDYYGNPGVMDISTITPVAGKTYFILPRPVYELYSFKFINTSGTSNTYNIGVYPEFELAYYDLNKQCNLLSLSYSFPYSNTVVDQNPNTIKIFSGYSATAPANWVDTAFQYTPGAALKTPITASSGQVRPTINFSAYVSGLTNTYPSLSTDNLLEGSSASVIQNVFGYGRSLPNYFTNIIDLTLPTDPDPATYVNYFETVIGQPLYDVGWTDRIR